jgi:hypothetical protein
MYEHYFANDLEFKHDVLDTMRNHRRQFLAFRFNLSHIKFFVTQWVPELLAHTKAQDESQVREHYDRGSAFGRTFLPCLIVCSDSRLRLRRFLQRLPGLHNGVHRWYSLVRE